METYMNTSNRVITLFSVILITACGGGGGGGGGSDSGYGGGSNNTNTPPNITNTVFNISVVESSSTAAFTVTASDADGNTLTYSLSGTDSGDFSISMEGVVTFNIAPDFENPADADTNNVYEITANVSDGTASDSENFTVTVTNDTSDDVTTENYDGTYMGAGPIQSATVCIEVTAGTCTGAQTATTAQDGTFSLTIDSGTTGILRGEGGFDPVTSLQLSDNSSFVLGQPLTDQNFIVSPLSTIMYAYDNSTDYDTFKTKLGLDSSFMIRTSNPFSDLSSASLNKAAVVNTQIMVLHELLNAIHTFETDSAAKVLATSIYNRAETETSLGDTTFIKNMLASLDESFSVTSDQLIDLSAGISAFLQKINANSSNAHSHFAKAGITELKTLMSSVMAGTSTSTEIDSLVFNTIDWINTNTSWDGGTITDNESDLSTTTYSLTNNGSVNYIVDSINPSDTDFIIYVKEGDVVKFDASNALKSSHPFKISTVQNATSDDSGVIGTAEGWDAGSLTLTVTSDTPETLYPYCDFHSGMYAKGKIVKVSTFDMANIDVTSQSSALQVKGTVATGPFKGASGYTYKVYLTEQNSGDHTHTFHEYPGLTFYMPGDQGYHGSETSSTDTQFKAKSHYAASDSGDGGGSDGY